MTLIEVSVALLLLTMGLIPVFFAIGTSIKLGTMIKNNIIAANLAQEGVELIRSMRDTNWFSGSRYDRGLADCGQPICSWIADWTAVSSASLVTSASIEADAPLYKNETTGLYGYSTSGAAPTGFKRQIRITRADPAGCDCQIRVESEVTWVQAGDPNSLTIVLYLYDWF